MATSPAVHSVENTPTTSKPRRSDTDFNPVIEENGQFRIAPAYCSLPRAKQDYALEAARQGIPESGKRLTNCLLCGSVFAHTRFNRKLALAHKFPCSEICCANCNRGQYRLRKWMARRDPDRICSSKLVGIELSIPYFEWRRDRESLFDIAKRLLLWLGLTDSAIFDCAPGGYCSIRVVTQCSGLKDCPAIRAKMRELGGPDAEVGFNHPEGVTHQHAKRLLSWALSGMEYLSNWPVEMQVAFRKLTVGLPLIRTTGTHFRRLTDAEVAERHELEKDRLLESLERKGLQMVYIPYDQRIVEPCSEIDDGWERVEYCVEFEGNVYPHTHATQTDRASP